MMNHSSRIIAAMPYLVDRSTTRLEEEEEEEKEFRG